MRRSLGFGFVVAMLAAGCNDDDGGNSTDPDLLGGCVSNPDMCTGDTECDPTTGRCVTIPECVDDPDCGSGACYKGACVACTTDAHCEGNAAGEACKTSTHTCVQCVNSGHCPGYPYGSQTCRSNKCSATACTSDSNCGSGWKCITDADKQKRCYASGCVTTAYLATSSAKPNWRGIYWGTLHEHTNWSLDAYFKSAEFLAGNSTASSVTYTPQGAYEFAMGSQSRIQEGKTVSMSANALDWVAITDHSEFFDTQEACVFGGGEKDTEFCKTYIDRTKSNTGKNTTDDYNGYIRQNQLVTEDPAYVCSNNLLFPGGEGEYACDHVRRDASLSTPFECSLATDGDTPCDAYVTTMWEESQRLADEYDTAGRNGGCKFATLNAFEYSSNITHKEGGSTSEGTVGNEHRNIIFRGPGNKTSGKTTVTPYPLDYITFPTPSLLWAALESYCPSGGTDAGKCRALAIPHNPNDSAGLKWEVTRDYDTKSTESTKPTDYGLARSKFEKLVEIAQHKGASECLNASPTGTDGALGADNRTYDPSCEFELGTTTTGLTSSANVDADADPSVTGEPDRSKDWAGYVRAGLGKGILAYYANTDAAKLNGNKPFNPLKLGVIGATDSHNSTPGYTPEANWHGNTGADDNTAGLRFAAKVGDGSSSKWNPQRYWNSGALTAVHAKRNVREDIWDALNNREAYATSGDRIKLWFFLLASGDTTDWCAEFNKVSGTGWYDVAEKIRTKIASGTSGATMGGTVGSGINKAEPKFLVFAGKDTRYPPNTQNQSPKAEDTHNLYEIDLVQTAVLDGTKTQDLVFRYKGASGGAASLCKVFTKADKAKLNGADKKITDTLSSGLPHLWYARVLETPTWSWRHFDCVALGATACMAAWPELCGAVKTSTDGKASVCTYNGTCTASTSSVTCTYADDSTTNAKDVFRNTYVRIRERAWSSPIWFMP